MGLYTLRFGLLVTLSPETIERDNGYFALFGVEKCDLKIFSMNRIGENLTGKDFYEKITFG